MYRVLCKGNGWASSPREYTMAKSLGNRYPTFANWLLNVVKMETINCVEVDLDVLHFSHPPNHIAYTYKNMWAHKNHYWVDENEGCMAHATYDSGVALLEILSFATSHYATIFVTFATIILVLYNFQPYGCVCN